MSTDIKYLNIPNVCFSLTEKDDDREPRFSKQRIVRGFDDSEIWSLTDTISNFIIPRLKRFRDIEYANCQYNNDNEWIDQLNLIITTFELIVRNNGNRIWTKEEKEQIDKGLELFKENFLKFWF